MEMYNVLEQGKIENSLIQGVEPSFLSMSSLLEQVQAMYNDRNPDFVVDQGLYYPTATNYGYYCTGFESPSEWEGHHRFGVDGREIQYMGAETENMFYVYCPPGYGYEQSPYNPYNPYIPGAVIGVDNPSLGAEQYYTIPSYQNPVSSPAYAPAVVQPDMVPDSSLIPLLDTGTTTSIVDGPNGDGGKCSLASASSTFPRNPPKRASNRTNFSSKISEGTRFNAGQNKQPVNHGSVSSGSSPAVTSSLVLQNRNASGSVQPIDNIFSGRILSQHNQTKVASETSAHGQAAVDKLRVKVHVGRALNDVNVSADAWGEQNRGPRTNRSKNQLAVKAYTTKAGDSNSEGNIIIHTDRYNMDDFPVGYVDAKFFVIKSYSEDDVHKSIKYNVWSSTPHGNKKLQSAYEDAQKVAAGKPGGCPIFFFFSVNASGQFCGVAQMTGPVDFHRDMDFWQQDKWSGSFAVKWHIIKDISNTYFRHIILENNENKPVTNSRDTQEIPYYQGLEMLKIFKNHTARTSLLDDFMYYENRQKIMQDDKVRLLVRSFERPFVASALYPSCKLNCVELPVHEDEKIPKKNDSDSLNGNEDAEHNIAETKDDVSSTLKIGSLTINPKQAKCETLADVTALPNTAPINIVTVGSMPVRVNGLAPSSGFLTVGTIPLDRRTLQLDKGDAIAKKAP
ncbi:YTH domain-containing protein ECT4-like isoform X1 [Tripterygium wilfordii]|nr:YTH domain-containing protein ECT4-like isoform X1 [Tripterygium wilfordii]XP_038720122.1 YTH domain-containing protein ECT4-like isoform X1 [Tripterygium wilfordii]